MPAVTDRSARVRPSRWWFALIPVLLLGGVAGAVFTAIDHGRAIADSFRTLGDDGTGTITLAAGEEATVWAVWDDGRSSDGLQRPPAAVRVVGPSGAEVSFDTRAGGSRTTFGFGSEAGIDLGTFVAPVSGDYDVSVTWQQGDITGAVPMAAVGVLDLSQVVQDVLRPLWLGVVASVVLLIGVIVLRGRSRRRIARRGAHDPLATSSRANPGLPTPPPPDDRGPIRFE